MSGDICFDTSATEKISDNGHGFFTYSLFSELIDEHFQLERKRHRKYCFVFNDKSVFATVILQATTQNKTLLKCLEM